MFASENVQKALLFVNTVKKFKITDYCIMHKKTIILSLVATSTFKSIIIYKMQVKIN